MKNYIFFICMLFIPFLSNAQINKGKKQIKQKSTKVTLPVNKEINICDIITSSYVFDSSNIYYSTTEKIEKVEIIRNVKGLDTNYYASLKVPGNIIIEEPKGVYAIINEYNKIVQPNIPLELKPNKDKIQNDDPYLYTAFIKITKLDFLNILVHGVLGFKLDIFETSLTEEENLILKKAMMCIWEDKVKITKK